MSISRSGKQSHVMAVFLFAIFALSLLGSQYSDSPVFDVFLVFFTSGLGIGNHKSMDYLGHGVACYKYDFLR